jgi:hypothetical protein
MAGREGKKTQKTATQEPAQSDPRPLLKPGERLGKDDLAHWLKLYGPPEKEGTSDSGRPATPDRWLFYESEKVKVYFRRDRAKEELYNLHEFSDGAKRISRNVAEARLEKRALYRLR